MNLIVDCGNTNLKYFIFHEQKLLFKNSFKWEDEWVLKIKRKFPDFKNILLCDVTGKYYKDDLEKKIPNKNIFEVKDLDLPFKTKYNFKSLGNDRIGLISAAINKFPGKDCLVVDAGSCLTFDLVSSQLVHEGGLISPGLLIRLKSLKKYTSSLPLTKLEDVKIEIGKDTKSSIQSGILEGFIFEVNGQIEKFKRKIPNLKIVLTGGDAKYLYKRIKNSIFAEQDFLASGLNNLLKCNKL